MSKQYNDAWIKLIDEQGESTPDLEVEFSSAWRMCKEEVLKILQEDLQNADLSTDKCDNRYIERIKKL